MKKKSANGKSWISHSAAETKKIGGELAKQMGPGCVAALYGDLGAGKTTLVQGIAAGLGVKPIDQVSSPTYVIIHEYKGKVSVYHLDWYRLKKIEGADEAMAEECFNSKGVTLVEWPDRGKALLPANHLKIRICHKNPTTRLIEVVSA